MIYLSNSVYPFWHTASQSSPVVFIIIYSFDFFFLNQIKKKLIGLTREHEALFNFVENNKHISTEKEKQKVQNVSYCFHHCSLFHRGGDTYWKKLSAWLLKFSLCSWLQMLNRLTKSAEMQARVDEEYFNINMEGHQMRLKWENTLKNCYQVEKIVSYLSFCGHLAVPLIKSGSLWDNGAQWRSQEFFISVKDFTSDWFRKTLKALGQLISQDSMFCILSTKTTEHPVRSSPVVKYKRLWINFTCCGASGSDRSTGET